MKLVKVGSWQRFVSQQALQVRYTEECRVTDIPVFPVLWMVLDSAVSLSQPSSCRFWYCRRTWVNVSSMSTGDCLAPLQNRYFLPQLRWFRVPVYRREREKERELQINERRENVKIPESVSQKPLFTSSTICCHQKVLPLRMSNLLLFRDKSNQANIKLGSGSD